MARRTDVPKGRQHVLRCRPLKRNGEFTASAYQVRFMSEYLKQLAEGGQPNPYEIVKGLGIAGQNWVNWQKKRGFTDWFLKRRDSFHRQVGLPNVHTKIYVEAMKDSVQDRKLYLERFDKDYKPKTEQSMVFAGSRPIDIDEKSAVEQSRKYIESQEV